MFSRGGVGCQLLNTAVGRALFLKVATSCLARLFLAAIAGFLGQCKGEFSQA
jgi:hypothetical protein